MSTIGVVHPRIYILVGCAGSGKGSIGKHMESLGYDPISTGDILRKEWKRKTEFGLKYQDAIRYHISNGIPFEEIQALVMKKIENAFSQSKGVILDGYPKTQQQCAYLDAFIQEKQLENEVVIVRLDVEKQNAVERIAYRQVCENCSKIYHTLFSPPKTEGVCDVCQEPLAERIDKDGKDPGQRIDEFEAKIEPVLNYYKNSTHFHILDANPPLEECLQAFIRFHRRMCEKV